MTTEGSTPASFCVVPHLRCLRYCGFCQLAPNTHVYLHRAHNMYCLLALSATTVYFVQECIYAYQERADMDKLSRVMFLLLCHVTSLAKQIVFHLDARRIDALVAEFDEPLLNQVSAYTVLKDTARSAFRLQRAYSGCAVVTCILWLVFPVVRFLRSQPVEFAFWIPAPVYQPFVFMVVLLYSFYVTTLVGIANTTMDAFIGAVLQQCTTQLKIVRTNLETLPDRTRQISKDIGESFESVQLKLFIECLNHYDKINQISSVLQDIFGTAILIQFTIGGWILCMAAYKMVSLNVLSVEFASMNLFIICILTEIFVYCFYGNELTYESARVLNSLYACGWERSEGRGVRPLQVRERRRFERALLLAGERARRPLRVAAARVIPLSLETFIKILKSSYTFYAVLRQTK